MWVCLSHRPESARMQRAASVLGVAPLSRWTVMNYSLTSLKLACGAKPAGYAQSATAPPPTETVPALWCSRARTRRVGTQRKPAQTLENQTWTLTTGLKTVNTKPSRHALFWLFDFWLKNRLVSCFQALSLQLQGKTTLVMSPQGDPRLCCSCV